MKRMNRRQLLVGAGGTSMMAWGANDRIRLALVGARNQGRYVAKRAVEAGGWIATVCDLDPAIHASVLPELERQQGTRPSAEKEFQRVLEDQNIDAVIIATPDHWHTRMAIQAMQAGKDVYVEKPLSQTIEEGHWIRDAQKRYGRVVQVGTQRRSGAHFHSAAEYVASGKLGKVCLVKAWMCQVRPSIGNPPDGKAPAGVDCNQWLGPAPARAFNENRFHYNWRFFWDYGNSELGNQGVHMLDVALLGIQKMRGTLRCLPAAVTGQSGIHWLQDAKEVPDTQITLFDFGDLQLSWELRSFSKRDPIEGVAAGTGFYGTEGTLVVDGDGWRVFHDGDRPAVSVKSEGMFHERNFLECMRSRREPNATVEIGRLSTMLCHFGNAQTRLGRQLRFDANTETFVGDAEANAMLRKAYRKGFEVPRVG